MTGLAGKAPSPRQSFGSLLCLAAAVLVLIGSFQTALSVSLRFPITAETETFTITSWGMPTERGDFIFAPLDGLAAGIGVPLMVAAAFLFAAAVLGVRFAPWATNASVPRVTGLMVLVGAVFLAGAVWTFGMQLIAWQRVWADPLPFGTNLSADTSIGPGYWMLVVAAAIAIAAATQSWRSGRTGTTREEPDTPVLGTPVVNRLPDEPPRF